MSNQIDKLLTHRSPIAAVLVAVCLLLMLAVHGAAPDRMFLELLALLTVILLVLGWAIKDRFLGVLVNERNIMSLARLQLAGWTVVVLAAYFTYVFVRNAKDIADPLMIGIDYHLWALLGISTASFVGSGLVLGLKKDKEPTPEAVKLTASLTADKAKPAADPAPAALVEAQTLLNAVEEKKIEDHREGTLYANPSKDDARFTDLFQGDEIGNTTHVDLAKVQMFLFTVVALGAFAAMIAKGLRHLPADPAKLAEALKQLPLLPEGLVAILGISHAGYLANKTVDHTKVTPP